MPAKQCPDCGRENDLDARKCFECGATLPDTSQMSPAHGTEPDARSVVLGTFHSTMTAQVAAKHLEDAGILVVVAADDCGGLYPFLTPVLGIRLLVKAADLPRAREALRVMEEQFGIKADDSGGNPGALADTPASLIRPSPIWTQLGLFLAGAVFGALAYSALTFHRSHYTGTSSEDRNGDSRPDAWWVYEKGELVKFSEDFNYDQRPDSWQYYRNGIIQSGETDIDYDGKVDVWYDYKHEVIASQRTDFDHDGRPDAETRYVAGLAATTDFTISNKLGYWRRDFYTNGILRETHLDRDRDGQLDERILYDSFGTFLRVEPMR